MRLTLRYLEASLSTLSKAFRSFFVRPNGEGGEDGEEVGEAHDNGPPRMYGEMKPNFSWDGEIKHRVSVCACFVSHLNILVEGDVPHNKKIGD